MTIMKSMAIMKRCKLHDRFLKPESLLERLTLHKETTNLLKKTKRGYFANVKINNFAANKKFPQTVKPLCSDKIIHKETKNLVGNDLILFL